MPAASLNGPSLGPIWKVPLRMIRPSFGCAGSEECWILASPRAIVASTGSQAFPTPSPSRSAWLVFATDGQLSSWLQTWSLSMSPPPAGEQTPSWQVSGSEQMRGWPSSQGVSFGLARLWQPNV